MVAELLYVMGRTGWSSWVQGFGDELHVGYGDVNQPRASVAVWSSAGLTIGGNGNDKALKVAKGQFGEVAVKAAYWADYVFQDDYRLRPLSEVESFIKRNGYLPNMPCENDVIENGLNVADITLRQQEKNRGADSLYMIEADKRMEADRKRIAQLERQMRVLLDRL